MGTLIDFPTGKIVEHANREAFRSIVIDEQDEALAALEILRCSAVKVREIPSDVLDTVAISDKDTGFHPFDADRLLDEVQNEVAKTRLWLSGYRMNRNKHYQEVG